MNRVAGKVALITGGGAGIGAASGQLFCAEGASVLLVDADADALARTAKAIAGQVPSARLSTFVADVADAGEAARAVERVLEAFGQLDVLVNNAAMRNYSALADAQPGRVAGHRRRQPDRHRQLLQGCAAGAAAQPPRQHRQRSSCYAVTGRSGMGLYDATKAGILAMTRTLAHEESAHGVRANAVCPGSTLTDFHLSKAKAAGKSVELLKSERQTTSLLGRWAAPQEIAWPILWLASDEASFITGATLMVDGGLSVM